MIAICHQCGNRKSKPLQRCGSCGAEPATDSERVLASALTDRFLKMERLNEVAALLRTGQQVHLPPEVQEIVLAAIEGPPIRDVAVKFGRTLGLCSLIVACLLFIYGIVALADGSAMYRWCAYKDTIPAYVSYLEYFPKSSYSDRARDRLRVLREPEVWAHASHSNDVKVLRDYIRTYPKGIHRDEALTRVREFADAQWQGVAGGRSVKAIEKFLRENPETSMRDAAKRRIQELHDDWTWVRKQDSLPHYRRFAERFPDHPEQAWIQKRIIDLEVNEIASGEVRGMPKAQPLTRGGVSAEVRVENKTDYELTVRYSGPDSKKLVLPSGAVRTVSLLPGEYRVAASVSASNVMNYFGSETMQGGTYSSSFYIQSGFGSIPSSSRQRRY